MRPGDERGFIHKKIFGGIKGAVGSVVGAITSGSLPTPAGIVRGGLGGFFGGGAPSVIRPPPIGRRSLGPPRPIDVRQIVVPGRVTGGISPKSITVPPIQEILDIVIPGLGGTIPGTGITVGGGGTSMTGPCADPQLVRDNDGICRFPGSPSGDPGEARKGRFGAGVEPMFVGTTVRRCPAGMVLGKGDQFSAPLCYESGAISNKERLWPKGTAPLLTGGEMAAIRKAATAKGKVARTAKRLGVFPKAARRLPAKRHQHALPAPAVSVS